MKTVWYSRHCKGKWWFIRNNTLQKMSGYEKDVLWNYFWGIAKVGGRIKNIENKH